MEKDNSNDGILMEKGYFIDYCKSSEGNVKW